MMRQAGEDGKDMSSQCDMRSFSVYRSLPLHIIKARASHPVVRPASFFVMSCGAGSEAFRFRFAGTVITFQ